MTFNCSLLFLEDGVLRGVTTVKESLKCIVEGPRANAGPKITGMCTPLSTMAKSFTISKFCNEHTCTRKVWKKFTSNLNLDK